MPIVAAMGAIAALLQAASEGLALVQQIQIEGREPTPDETRRLRALSDAAHRAVQSA